MIILDTNVVSETIKPLPDIAVRKWLIHATMQDLYVTAITEAELRYGIEILPSGKRKDELSRSINSALAKAFENRILPFDGEAAKLYAVIGAHRRRIGRPIDDFDCQIAAIARTKGAALATRNVRDFDECGITIIDPWQA